MFFSFQGLIEDMSHQARVIANSLPASPAVGPDASHSEVFLCVLCCFVSHVDMGFLGYTCLDNLMWCRCLIRTPLRSLSLDLSQLIQMGTLPQLKLLRLQLR